MAAPAQPQVEHLSNEHAEFTWAIPNFVNGRKSAEYLAINQSTLALGEPIGLLVTLAINLILHQKWVCAYFRVTQKPPTAAQVLVRFQLKIGDYRTIDTGVLDFHTCHLISRVMPQDEDVTRLPLTAKGELPIEVQVTVFNDNSEPPSPETTLAELRTLFQERFQGQLADDWKKVCEPSGGPVNVQVVSREGREFTADARVLAARSPLLMTMLEEGVVKKGVWKMSDMAGDALEVFLQFVNTATLHDSWTELDVLRELTMAAKKYQLKDLLEFLDEAFELLATPGNCDELFLLANLVGLERAKGALMTKFQGLWQQAAKDLMEQLRN